ncbi:MAG TPA: hypothetical protein VGN69_10145, partial [Solirubrobacteraceae bacterium]|nr:hypothetical protein [Solirubrobacteraceae bacterium]
RTVGNPLRRPLHLCPSCLGVTRDLSITTCPDCHVELLARVPISGQRPVVASGRFPARTAH